MSGIGDEEWIRTEGLQPVLRILVVGAVVIDITIAVVCWRVFVPLFGGEDALGLLVALYAAGAWADLLLVNFLRPTAVRVSGSGLEVRRLFGSSVPIPADRLTLRDAASPGYGLAVLPSGAFYVLAPKQYAAARSALPQTIPRPSGGTPLSS